MSQIAIAEEFEIISKETNVIFYYMYYNFFFFLLRNTNKTTWKTWTKENLDVYIQDINKGISKSHNIY